MGAVTSLALSFGDRCRRDPEFATLSFAAELRRAPGGLRSPVGCPPLPCVLREQTSGRDSNKASRSESSLAIARCSRSIASEYCFCSKATLPRPDRARECFGSRVTTWRKFVAASSRTFAFRSRSPRRKYDSVCSGASAIDRSNCSCASCVFSRAARVIPRAQ